MPTNTNHTQTDVSASNEAPLAPLVRQEGSSDTSENAPVSPNAPEPSVTPATPDKITPENMLKFQGNFLSDMNRDQIRSALESLGQDSKGSDSAIRQRLKDILRGDRKLDNTIITPKRKTYKSDLKIANAVDTKTRTLFEKCGKQADFASEKFCDSLETYFDLHTQAVALKCRLELAQERSKTWSGEIKDIRKKLTELKQESKSAKRKLSDDRKEALQCVKKYRMCREDARKKAKILEVERALVSAKEKQRKASEKLAKLAN